MKKINIERTSSYGTFSIYTTYYGKTYKTDTHNTLAIDRLTESDLHPRAERFTYTAAAAAKALYNEILTANRLK